MLFNYHDLLSPKEGYRDEGRSSSETTILICLKFTFCKEKLHEKFFEWDGVGVNLIKLQPDHETLKNVWLATLRVLLINFVNF